mgnify:CR=1 FL=1
MAFDYKKEYKEFYLPPRKPGIVTVPPMNFVSVQGRGDPNEPGGEYQAAMELLYGIAFTIKMSYKGSHKIDGYFEYVVPPLEGLWHQEGVDGVDYAHKECFEWTSMIRLPDFVTREVFDWAVQEATAKKKKDFSKVQFFHYDEGLCVQCMHVGSYDAEPETLEQMDAFAEENGLSLYGALSRLDEITTLKTRVAKFKDFYGLFEQLRADADGLSVSELIDAIVKRTGYLQLLMAEGTDDALNRIQNIDEFVNKAAEYDKANPEGKLEGFLEEVALVADIDSYEEGEETVALMTLHSAKGLEFPYVFIIGMEEGIFPGFRAVMYGGEKEIEEERKKLEKEQQHYQNALQRINAQLEAASDADRAAIEEKKAELVAQLDKIDKEFADVDYREANQRAGYVYVISNIGAFGENVYKIGMTRRLDPQDRVDELGDASVPFNFDVHAMIFSNDAPKLEAALHNAFADRKLNFVNQRREFFNVSLDEIKQVIKDNYDKSVEFVELAPAEQYRESLKLKEQMKKKCIK